MEVTSSYDDKADFSQYQTFNFKTYKKLGEFIAPEELIQQLIQKAITGEMESRGYTLSENPDVMFNILIKAGNKIEKKQSNVSISEEFYDTQHIARISLSSYREGILIIDMVEANENKLVWRGAGKKKLPEYASKLNKKANQYVKSIFEGYPVTAK